MSKVHRIVVGTEDRGHEAVVPAILKRFFPYSEVVSFGINRPASELKRSFKRLETCDLLVLAKDANDVGLHGRSTYLMALVPDVLTYTTVLCIPDPYIERWLLLDAKAFSHVYGRGFDAPKITGKHAYYKDYLKRSIKAAGHAPMDGFERAADIINAMDFDTIKDDSFQLFITELKTFLNKE